MKKVILTTVVLKLYILKQEVCNKIITIKICPNTTYNNKSKNYNNKNMVLPKLKQSSAYQGLESIKHNLETRLFKCFQLIPNYNSESISYEK